MSLQAYRGSGLVAAAILTNSLAYSSPAIGGPAALPREAAAPVQLSVDAQRNKLLERSLKADLAGIQRRHASQLCFPLGGTAALAMRPAYCQGTVDPDMQAGLVVTVLRDGAIVRHVSFGGASLERPMPMGSLAKMVLAVPMLAHEGARADEKWCRKAVPGLRNADGFEGVVSCEGREAQRSAIEAIAASDNLATIWRLGRVDAHVLVQHLATAKVGWPSGEVTPAVAAALGVVELTPRAVLECHEALVTGRARRATMVNGGKGAATDLARWCAQAVSTPQRAAFVRSMLQAPLGVSGTAGFLPPMSRRVTWLTAKTGTPTTNETLDSGKLMVFSLRVRGARYTAFIGLASPRPNWPLARRLASSDLRPLVESVLKDLLGGNVRPSYSAPPTGKAPHRNYLSRTKP